jgi:hypothetical protein
MPSMKCLTCLPADLYSPGKLMMSILRHGHFKACLIGFSCVYSPSAWKQESKEKEIASSFKSRFWHPDENNSPGCHFAIYRVSQFTKDPRCSSPFCLAGIKWGSENDPTFELRFANATQTILCRAPLLCSGRPGEIILLHLPFHFQTGKAPLTGEDISAVDDKGRSGDLRCCRRRQVYDRCADFKRFAKTAQRHLIVDVAEHIRRNEF